MVEETKEIKKEENQKGELPVLKPGMTVRVHQQVKEVEQIEEKGKVKDKERKRIQIFEGVIISKRGGDGVSGTITVRKISNGIGVEKIFPIHSPTIVKIEPVKKARVRRAKLYYLRDYNKKLKEVPF